MNFYNLDDLIDLSEKKIEQHKNDYNNIQSKISIISAIYTILAVYTVQVIKFPFKNPDTDIFILCIYSIFLIGFIFFFIWSISFTYRLLNPVKIAHINDPEFFYKTIKEDYENQLKTNNEQLINEYIKTTYLKELEQAIEVNFLVKEKKGKLYYDAFNKGLFALACYSFCASFVILNNDNVQNVKISNYKEITTFADSLDKTIMNEEQKDTSNQASSGSESPKVDPDKVIVTKPRMIYENYQQKEFSDLSAEKPSEPSKPDSSKKDSTQTEEE